MNSAEGLDVRIEQWPAGHTRTSDLRSFIDRQGQLTWYDFVAAWHRTSHTLVATVENHIVGVLRFVVQEIGPEYDRDSVTNDNSALTEAKVLTFAVDSPHQRHGVGSRLQLAAVSAARELGCFQIRSFSSGSNVANHALKLKLGFAVVPDPRESDPNGLCFVLPLATSDMNPDTETSRKAAVERFAQLSEAEQAAVLDQGRLVQTLEDLEGLSEADQAYLRPLIEEQTANK